MKVELEINDLHTLVSALSIGTKFLGNETMAQVLCCQPSAIIEQLFELYNITDPNKKIILLKDRFYELKNITEQLTKLEGSDDLSDSIMES